MKYILYFTLLILPIFCNAVEFVVVKKFQINAAIKEIIEKKYTVVNIEPLDMDKDGYVKIICE